MNQIKITRGNEINKLIERPYGNYYVNLSTYHELKNSLMKGYTTGWLDHLEKVDKNSLTMAAESCLFLKIIQRRKWKR